MAFFFYVMLVYCLAARCAPPLMPPMPPLLTPCRYADAGAPDIIAIVTPIAATFHA